MIYSWDKFLRPLATTDTNIQIMNNSGIVTQTINPYAVINILIHNNTIRIGMKSGQIVIIPFSNMNEAKLALPRIKQMVDSLQKKKPMFINNEIKNFVKSETTDFFYQSNTPTGSGTDLINVGSFWYDTDTGFLYVYISDELSGYNWVTAAGEIGPVGATGSQGYSYQFSGVISSSASLPISATAGISYIDELSGNLWVYNSNFSNWVNGGLVRGSSGTSGTSGSAGTSGSTGTSGTSGTSGSSGTSGTDGSSGSAGTSGTSGTSGSSGTSGTDGSSGSAGTSGTSGTSGTDGTSGPQGIQGVTGPTGSNGLNGVHNPIIISGGTYNSSLGAAAKVAILSVANRLDLMPFIPIKTFTTASLSIECSSAVAGSNTIILIYSDNNGVPGTKIVESPDLSTATLGVRTFSTTQTFTAGVCYWIGVHTSSTQSLRAIPLANMLNIGTPAITSSIHFNMYRVSVTYGSAPTTYSGGVLTSAIASEVRIAAV